MHFPAKTLRLSTVAMCVFAALANAADVQKRNILFILMDDLGYSDVGCYGNQAGYETPNIDRLASQGMRFTDGYAACNCCSPTRASILTGKYPARLHITDWIAGGNYRWAKLRQPNWTKYLPLEEVTIAEALKRAGYVSACIGKWHLAGPHNAPIAQGSKYFPEAQGFDTNLGGCASGCPRSHFFPYGIPVIKHATQGEFLTERLTEEARKFMAANKDNPFFLYLSHYTPHRPLQAKREVIAKYRAKGRPAMGRNNATHAAMVESMDDSVGQVMQQLDRLGIADRTVVFFTSDNGGLTRKFEGNNFVTVTTNAPLRQGKGSPYEGGVRVPWIVKWPGVIKPGTTCGEPIHSVDVYPTILEIAGVQDQSGHVVDGLSIVPLLKQSSGLKREAIFWHYPHYNSAAEAGVTPHGAVRCGRYKLIQFYEDMRVELYDLEDDIGEKKNLIAQMPEKATQLSNQLQDWLKKVDAQMPTSNPSYDPVKAEEIISFWRRTGIP
jgi:arylsulfatase A-like enzyme